MLAKLSLSTWVYIVLIAYSWDLQLICMLELLVGGGEYGMMALAQNVAKKVIAFDSKNLTSMATLTRYYLYYKHGISVIDLYVDLPTHRIK
uniref:AlNc14C91G5696 protein n=1 Tax=Albugo laibachii Nc14 TaxID=890382 RepID=F0WGG3_9STRA|nr:AlNc14C91G5696 [Albugo laibachii Nc14]|eukprot:CCA20326.1 AlNc14C91G5696 [Albugo laibachii Nc14]